MVLAISLTAAGEKPKGYAPAVFKKEIVPLLKKYCYKCHDEDVQKGDMRLDIYLDASQILPHRKHWLKVLEQLETREMPTKKPLPSETEYEKLIEYVDKAANDIDWEKIKEPGHVTIPLLTKEEYYNTLQELTGLDLRTQSTFSEDSEGISGFTNDRDGLFVSTSKMEKYLQTAEAAVDSLIAIQKGPFEWKLESEKMFMTETRERPKKISADFFGFQLNRGQMSLYESIDIPADGLYEISARIQPSGAFGATELRVDNRLSGKLEAEGKKASVRKLLLPLSKGSRQFTWNISDSNLHLKSKVVVKKPDPAKMKAVPAEAGKKQLRLDPKVREAAKKAKYNMKKLDGAIKSLQQNIEYLRVLGVNGPVKEIIKKRGAAGKAQKTLNSELKKLGSKIKQKIASSFNKQNAERLKDNKKILDAVKKVNAVSGRSPIAIDWMAVRGPLVSPGTPVDKVFVTWPDAKTSKEQAALQIITEFLPRAFRRPAARADVDKYLNLFRKSMQSGAKFEESIKLSLVAILVSPRFLFRDELKKTDGKYKLDDYQLASRLSYFLWMSMPDDELFKLAGEGKLSDPAVLRQQIKRMTADKKVRRFVSAFTGEWLGFKALGKSVMPDEKKFPGYTVALNDSAKLETVMMFEDLFRNGGSLFNLVDSKYSYINDKLASHYGMKGVTGSELRKTALNNPQRGGLLGMTSILTATSTPSRTSPVNRGLWVFEKLLGQHMGTPPADVPPLPENAASHKKKTLREVFEEHRDNPACANCHNKIDPLGFGLENFDAIGRYRSKQNGKQIDASGKMPDGSSFNGIVELKQYILKKKRKVFLRNVTQRLLSFALGRDLQYFDEPAIKKIVAAVEKNNYSSKTLLQEVILSYPFLNQSNSSEIVGDIK